MGQGRGRSVWVVAVAAALVLLTGTGTAVVRLVGRSGDGSTPAAGGAARGAVPGTERERALAELTAFVERARGLPFLRPPSIHLLSDEEFDALGEATDPRDPTPAGAEADGDDAYLGVLRALGLLAGDEDFDEEANEYADIVGFYDTDHEALYIRGTELTPYVRQVIVHELTHALDDQHFEISGAHIATDDEALAFEGLVEGDAVVVEGHWFDGRPPPEQAEIDREEGGWPPEEDLDADVFTRFDVFPYVAGSRFVRAVLAAGGPPRLDEAFARPPLTTEQILHPERYLAGEAVKDVAPPAADGRRVDGGTLGELGLMLVLDTAVDHPVAVRGAEGWGGDRYVAWRSRGLTCVRWSIVMDTGADTTEVVSALRLWAARRPSASVTQTRAAGGTEAVGVTTCA